MSPVEEKVADLLSLLLKAEVHPGDDVTMKTCPIWNSMKHIEIVMTMEESFHILFDPVDIPTLTSQARLVEKIRDLLHVDA